MDRALVCEFADRWMHAERDHRLIADWPGGVALADAYSIQLEILERRKRAGEVHAGWKVGLTAPAMRRQQGVDEPCFGFLLESGHRASGARIPFDDINQPGIENELCLTIGRPLAGRVSYAEARAAVAQVEPAIEVVEQRGHFAQDLSLTMVLNAQQYAFVTGRGRRLDDSLDLASVALDLAFNGAECERAHGREVMGDPINSVVWLAGMLARYGRRLEPGHKVMSGSFTRQYPVARGDVVHAHFEGFDAVEVSFP